MAALKRLRLAGWMPFAGDFELILPAAAIAVVARYASNPRRSNMAGKTALMEAITWCLFGVHRKRLDDDIINGAVDGCFVELAIGDVEVRRAKKRGSPTVLTVRSKGETYRMHVAQTVLLDRLALSLDDYQATANFAQGDIESLVGMKTAKRREVISGWLRLERWALAGKKAAERMKAATIKLREDRLLLSTVEAKALKPEHEAGLRDELAGVSGQRKTLSVELTIRDRELIEIGDPSNLDAGIRDLTRLRDEAASLKAALKDRRGVETAHAEAQSQWTAATIAFEKADGRRASLAWIRDVGFDGRCPVMCSPCPVADDVTAAVKNGRELFARAEADVRAAEAPFKSARAEVVAAQQRLKELERSSGRFASVVEQGKTLAKRVGERTMEDVEALRAKQRALKEKRTALLDGIAKAVHREAELNAQLAGNEAAKKQRAAYESDLKKSSEEARIAALIVQALGPAGVPAMLAKVYVERLEEAANVLLADSGISLEFGWQRETKDLAPTCPSCGHVYVGQRDRECPACGVPRGPKMTEELEILVDDGSGEIEDVKMKSGGARVLVASALRLAASAMLREVRGTPVGWATIDEPFGPLDEENREHLARVFGGMLGAVGLEQAFVVSHDVALLDALPYRIMIERDGAVSTVRLEAS